MEQKEIMHSYEDHEDLDELFDNVSIQIRENNSTDFTNLGRLEESSALFAHNLTEEILQGIQISSVNINSQQTQTPAVNHDPIEQLMVRFAAMERDNAEMKRNNAEMKRNNKEALAAQAEINRRASVAQAERDRRSAALERKNKRENDKLREQVSKVIVENGELKDRISAVLKACNQLEEKNTVLTGENKELKNKINQVEITNQNLVKRNASLEAKDSVRISYVLREIINEVNEKRWDNAGFPSSKVPEGIQMIRDILCDRTKYNASWLDPTNNNVNNVNKVIDLARSIHDVLQKKVLFGSYWSGAEQKNFYQRSYENLTKVMGNFNTSEIEKVDNFKERESFNRSYFFAFSNK